VTAAKDQAATKRMELMQLTGNVAAKLWCGYHQGYANASTGRYQERNGKRWMCVNCMKLRGIAPE